MALMTLRTITLMIAPIIKVKIALDSQHECSLEGVVHSLASAQCGVDAHVQAFCSTEVFRFPPGDPYCRQDLSRLHQRG